MSKWEPGLFGYSMLTLIMGSCLRWGRADGSLIGVYLNKKVEKFAPLEQRVHAHILIEAMNVSEVRSDENRFDAVSRNPGRIEELTDSGARLQDGQNRNAGPEFRREFFDGT